jgi:hypothetical protein
MLKANIKQVRKQHNLALPADDHFQFAKSAAEYLVELETTNKLNVSAWEHAIKSDSLSMSIQLPNEHDNTFINALNRKYNELKKTEYRGGRNDEEGLYRRCGAWWRGECG